MAEPPRRTVDVPVDDEFISAQEAADLLGVNLPTLYAYVSRKGLRSVPVPGTRYRRYWRADIERMSRKAGSGPASAEFERESAITLITPKAPYYRGRSAVDLAETASLEDVARLLWDCAEVDPFADPPSPTPAGYVALDRVLTTAPAVDRASGLLPLLERANPRAYDLTAAGMARTGADVLRWLCAILLRRTQASERPLHLQFGEALGLRPELSELVRRLLVLSADHAFEPGTFAVRAVASTGVTPWRAVMTGLSVATGRRSRFGQFAALRRFIREVTSADDPREPVVSRLQDGEPLPGFDPGIYPDGDPRGRALLAYCEEALADDPGFRRLQVALGLVREVTGQAPNFAFANAYAEQCIGVASETASASVSSSETPFLLGRAAGWIAHAIEQYQRGESAHRLVIYRGELPG